MALHDTYLKLQDDPGPDGPRRRPRKLAAVLAALCLGAVPLAVAALLRLPLAPHTLASRVRAILDGLVIAASILVVSWIVALRPLVRAGAEELAAQVVGLAYPIGDIVIVTLVLYVLLRSRAGGAGTGTVTAAPRRSPR